MNFSHQAADHINVTGLTILVVGTQNPWLEAVLLSKNPKKVVTLEYGYFIRCGNWSFKIIFDTNLLASTPDYPSSGWKNSASSFSMDPSRLSMRFLATHHWNTLGKVRLRNLAG